MSVQERQKVGFAISFAVAILGAMFLIASQIPLRTEYYDLIDTRSFSFGQQLTFYWTFDPNVEYRFEVKGVNWTALHHYLSVFEDTRLISGDLGALVEPPWVWHWSYGFSRATMNVTFWHPGIGGYAEPEIEQATTPTLVEISARRQGTYRLTHLVYVGLPLLIISAILITVIGRDAESRMRMQDTIKK